MSESALHKDLVQQLVSSIATVSNEWFLFVEGKCEGSHGVPPLLSAFRPDVYARHRQTSHVVIGEAKTVFDIDALHTHVQLAAYFGYLKAQASAELRVAVPYLCVGQAIRVCRQQKLATSAAHVPFIVSGWMSSARGSVSRDWRG